MAARRRSRQEWKRIVLEWRQSGLTKAQFARRHGLNPTTFALSEGGLGGGAAASAAPACTRLFHRRTHGSAAVLPASHRRLDRRVSPYRVLAGFRSSRRCRSRCCPARARTATREVRQIAVRRERWNQGIGGRLLRAAEDWGQRVGAEFASLEYLAANERASLFYQKHMGYRVVSSIAVKRLSR